MHTLMTQLRLQRLLRLHGELAERLAAPGIDPRLASAAVRKLLKAVADVQESWRAEVARAGTDLGPLRSRVTRSISELAGPCVSLEQPAADPLLLDTDFRESCASLLLLLRGLESTQPDTLRAWLKVADTPLRRPA